MIETPPKCRACHVTEKTRFLIIMTIMIHRKEEAWSTYGHHDHNDPANDHFYLHHINCSHSRISSWSRRSRWGKLQARLLEIMDAGQGEAAWIRIKEGWWAKEHDPLSSLLYFFSSVTARNVFWTLCYISWIPNEASWHKNHRMSSILSNDRSRVMFPKGFSPELPPSSPLFDLRLNTLT